MSSSTIPQAPPTAQAPHVAPLGSELASARARLKKQRDRVRQGICIETAGVVALLLVAYALPTLLTDRFLRLEWVFRAALLASFLVVLARTVRNRLMQPLEVKLSDEEMALAVERKSPELEQVLISSLQFDQELACETRSIESKQMKAAVVNSVRDRLQSIPFARAVNAGRLWKFSLGIFVALQFFGAWAAIDTESLGIWAKRNVLLSNVDWPRYTALTFAGSSGDIRLPQGDALMVRVNVKGTPLDEVALEYAFSSGEVATEPMSRTGDDEFSWAIDSVLEDVTLTVQGGDSLPVKLAVTIVERPQVNDLLVRVELPEYMEREPFDVPGTEGELRLPEGAKLKISGRSQKTLASAFLLAPNDQRVLLSVGDDKKSFTGEFRPRDSGLIVVDVIDSDSLGAGSPPKLLLRVGEDKAPSIDFRLRGIGSSITSHARIPGILGVRDDFGLREVNAVMRAVEDRPTDRGVESKPLMEEPWIDAQPIYDQAWIPSALRYESEASVDLATWNTVPDQNAPSNPIRPGMLFSLRYSAKDNFGPGDPHEGFSEVMTFRVVTRDQLVEELRRRQVEKRVELQEIAKEEAQATIALRETVNPAEAGDERKLATTRFTAMARRQQALGRRVRFVADAYQRILWEFENNRLIESNKVRQIESVITVPLEVLAREAFPATARLVNQFSRTPKESIRQAAIKGYEDIELRLAAVLKEMEQAENLAALIEELRNVINLETEAIRDVKQRVRNREDSIFKTKKNK
jgi:hypothetical protein